MLTTPHERRWTILFVLCIAVFLVVVDNTIVNVALPTLSRDFRASNSSLQWIVDGYSLPFAGLLLSGGGLADRWGRKRVMMVALVAFGLFSFLAAHSHDIASLLSARALMGSAAAFIFPATLSLVTVTFDDPNERATAFGIWGAVAGVAVAVGPIVGGALITHYWFGSIFLVNLPIVFVALVATALVVPESKNPVARRLDVGGLVLGTAGILLLVLAIIEGPSWGWLSLTTMVLFVSAAMLLVSFGLYEIRRTGPLFDVRLFRSGAFSAGAASIATSYFCLFGFIFLVTQYFQMVRGYSALSAGVHTLPFAIITVVATPLGALLALRVGARYVVAAGLGVMAAALTWMSFVAAAAAYVGPILGSMSVLAVGFSLINAPSTASLMGTLSPDQVGSGAAMNETTRELGGTLGVAVTGSVFSSLFGPHLFRLFRGAGLSSVQLHSAQSSMQAAQAAVAHFPPALQVGALHAVTQSFMQGLHRGCLVAAIVAASTGVAVLKYLPTRASSAALSVRPGATSKIRR